MAVSGKTWSPTISEDKQIKSIGDPKGLVFLLPKDRVWGDFLSSADSAVTFVGERCVYVGMFQCLIFSLGLIRQKKAIVIEKFFD